MTKDKEKQQNHICKCRASERRPYFSSSDIFAREAATETTVDKDRLTEDTKQKAY